MKYNKYKFLGLLLIPLIMTCVFGILNCNEDCECADNVIPQGKDVTHNFVSSTQSLLPPYDLQILTTCPDESTTCKFINFNNEMTVDTDDDKNLFVSPYIDYSNIRIQNNQKGVGPYSPPIGKLGPEVSIWLMPTSTFNSQAVDDKTGLFLGSMEFEGSAETEPAKGPKVKVDKNYLPNSPTGGWHIFAQIINNNRDADITNDFSYLGTMEITNSGNDYAAIFSNSVNDVDTMMILFDETVATSGASVLSAANAGISTEEDMKTYCQNTLLIDKIISFHQSFDSKEFATANVSGNSTSREDAYLSDNFATEDAVKNVGWSNSSASLMKRLKAGGTFFLRVQKSPWIEKTPASYEYSIKWQSLSSTAYIYEAQATIPVIDPAPVATSIGNITLDANGTTAQVLAESTQFDTTLGASGNEVHWYKIVMP